jgi:HPt (histidine-containing phosphotransfer) domain-containing protein
MDDYLAKPFKRQQLEALLAQYVRGRGAVRAPGAAQPQMQPAGLRLAYAKPEGERKARASVSVLPVRSAPATATSEASGVVAANEAAVLDTAALAAIRALERPGAGGLLRRVIDRYNEDAPRLVQNMRAAAADQDAHALQVAAHTLKSASANLGAAALASLCKGLEMRGRSGQVQGAGEALPELERELARVSAALQAELAQQAAS